MFPGIGFQELLIVGVIAVLLFGKRLPDVGRSLGKSLGEFRRGMQDIQNEMHAAMNTSGASSSRPAMKHRSTDDYDEPTAPKFEPPAAEPAAEAAVAEVPSEASAIASTSTEPSAHS